MARFLVISAFTCLEYAIVFLFIASTAFMLAQSLDVFVLSAYDYTADQEILEAVSEGYKSKQITGQQGAEILQIYREDRDGGQRLRKYILYAVSICISAAFMILLFKKYRLLRFRERIRDYFFPAPS